MAIQFARLEKVKRSAGKNACQKSAYNGNLKLKDFQTEKKYDYTMRGSCCFHEILLPSGVDKKFIKAEILWNAVEVKETRVNSQLANEVVLALPDDPEITLDHKISLSKSFAQRNFVDKGLAAQINIHMPSNKNKESNWHAHLLIPTRRFDETGKSLDKKARDLDATVCKGRVVAGTDWGELWRTFQNDYFNEIGLDLRVDPTGIVPQKHLGPVRMRVNNLELVKEDADLKEKNLLLSSDVSLILKKITENRSVFTNNDLENYIKKHVSPELLGEVREKFWKQADILKLYDKKGKIKTERFTTKEVLSEEDRIVRYAKRLSQKKSFSIKSKVKTQIKEKRLNEEQFQAFSKISEGSRFCCIQGAAGTGKSFLIQALRESYENSGFDVRGLSPTNEVSKDMRNNGFAKASTLHHFIYKTNNSKSDPKKELWIIDEASMVENKILQEILKLAWKNNNQVVLVGDYNQLPSVGRGGLFKFLCEKFGCAELSDIQRQEQDWSKEVSVKLSKRETGKAIDQLVSNKAIFWSDTKEESMIALLKRWQTDRVKNPNQTSFILEHRNSYVTVLNNLIHEIRRNKGEIGKEEFACESCHGRILISSGDRIQFRATDTEKGIVNGNIGFLKKIGKDSFTVMLDDGKEVSFNPQKFSGFQLGYAGTYFKSQGKTVDRAYVMHSPLINQNLAYVGLTRHRKDVCYFVSKDEASCLSALKYQISRPGDKEATFNYISTLRDNNNEEEASIWEKLKTFVADYYHKDEDLFESRFKENVIGNFNVMKVDRIPEGIKASDDLQKAAVQCMKEIENETFSLNNLSIEKKGNKNIVESLVMNLRNSSRLNYVKERMELNDENTNQDQIYLEFKKINTFKPQIVDFLVEKGFHGKMLDQLTELGLSFYMKNDRIFSDSELCRIRELIENTPLFHGFSNLLEIEKKSDRALMSEYVRENIIEESFFRSFKEGCFPKGFEKEKVQDKMSLLNQNYKDIQKENVKLYESEKMKGLDVVD